MISMARPLKISELLELKKVEERSKTLWCRDDQYEILMHKSWVSLKILFEWITEKLGRRPILFLPDYYCRETIENIQELVDILFYRIKDDYLPDYKHCSEVAKYRKPDVFLFVHYFGATLDASIAKVFCENNQTILIEDATHVLLPQKKVGNYGHFVLYSPWKSYGLSDGAVLVINRLAIMNLDPFAVYKELQQIENLLPIFPKKKIRIWKIRKIIHRWLPNLYRNYKGKKIITYNVEKENAYKISEYNRKMLLSVTEEQLLFIGERKKENYLVLKTYLNEKYGINTILENLDIIPYALIIRPNNKKDIETIENDLLQIGRISSQWPALPLSLPKDSIAIKLRDNSLIISVHDGMSINKIIKALNIHDCSERKIEIEEIECEEYSSWCRQYKDPLPILQSVGYLNAKRDIQGWTINYWKAVEKDNCIAVFATLKKYGIVYRINHGPLMNEMLGHDILMAIKKKFGKNGKILFIAPNMKKTGENLLFMVHSGFLYRQQYFTTGFIDLTQNIELIRKGLESKWRNALKNAEKRNIIIENICSLDVFNIVLEKHILDKNKRNYKDSGDLITRYLFENGYMTGFLARSEKEEIISFVLLALHENTGTYYIGWSNEEGYKVNASRLLVWKMIMYLKENGYIWFDLGGLDYIHTKSVAEFKAGTGCEIYSYVGEFRS